MFATYGEYVGLLGGVQGQSLELEVTVGDGQPGDMGGSLGWKFRKPVCH